MKKIIKALLSTYMLLKLVYSSQVYKMFNPDPLELSPEDLALTINLSNINATHQAYVATRQPASQQINESSIEAIVDQRKQLPKMVFTDQISVGIWVKVPESFSFETEISFLQMYFPEVKRGTQFRLFNEEIVSQKDFESQSFSQIDLAVSKNEWFFLTIDYHLTPLYYFLEVKVNDKPYFTLDEESSLFKNKSLDNTLLSVGTTDFTLPFVKWY